MLNVLHKCTTSRSQTYVDHHEAEHFGHFTTVERP